MRIQILPSAIADLNDGWIFYESQDVGLGDYFQTCLSADIDSLEISAGIHRQVYGFHRLLAKRFPFAVYYRMESDQVALVYRVLDCRRDPVMTRRSLRQTHDP
jgi:hypothetical protein